jgi:hypothetical protein
VEYEIRFDQKCLDDLARIFGGVENANPSIQSVLWRLGRDPHRDSWELEPGRSDIRLAYSESYAGGPVVVFSFRIVIEEIDRYCLLLRARAGNDPRYS